MRDRESELLDRWEREKDTFSRWGSFVVNHLKTIIGARISPRNVDYFVRVPATPRLKDDESLVQKAFHRGKSYSSPYDDIEDKVGARFVLLLDTDVRLVGSIIEAENAVWTAVKARDHEDEIENSPYEFNYQSLHYVVRSTENLEWGGKPIPQGLPCEIQVKTLLQHAYSEVTHDTLYKPSIKTTPKMKRAAAKSMALLEATSDYFDKLNALIFEQVRPLQQLSDDLAEKYTSIVGFPPRGRSSPLNDLVLDRYGREVDAEILGTWLQSKPFIGARIAERANIKASFRIPGILLIYYSAFHQQHSTPNECPIPEGDLELIYSDLGRSLNG